MEKKPLVSHAEAAKVLRKAGYSQEQIQELLRELPDPIDVDREAVALTKLGLNLGDLTDRMGASP